MARGRKTGGRKAGEPNKITKALKDMILGALDDAGGQAYLVQQAKANPKAFLALLGRVLPTQINGGLELTGKDGEPLHPVIYMPANGRDG